MSRPPTSQSTPQLRAEKVIPARVSAPKTGVSSDALVSALMDLQGSDDDVKAEALRLLCHARDTAMESARKEFEAGRQGGLETARRIAAIHDDIVRALFHLADQRVFPVSNPTASDAITVCAVGGYGRGEMAPQSDLDLLFLHADKRPSPRIEQMTEYMLYMLWDMGLKVGHSTRNIEQNIKLAKTDQTILTALLDLRFLCGEPDIAVQLFQKFRSSVAKGKGRKYITVKLEERDLRHDREGNSRYRIEPNIKEGKGGLRDLHVLYWIARFLDRSGVIIDPQRGRSYVDMGLFDEKGAQRFARAADFLWRTRIYLHFQTGRATENLTFEHQTVLARKMGYASGPIEEAVEKFMREYFTNAREVGALTRIACAKLEADNALKLPKGLDAFFSTSRRALTEQGFTLEHGRLTFKDPLKLRTNPSWIMELFEIAGRRNHDIHPDALGAIDFRRNMIDANFRRDKRNADIFLKILLGAKAPYATLKVMNESGVLGRYILEFGHIVARTQFNMHHAYTVDEHTLRLVDHFHNLEFGIYEKDNPIATNICKTLETRQRRILYLACLLHDIGKGQGDQCIDGARLARRACRRMGIEQTEIESVSWLVRRHLDMSETAQRRDISDPQTIREFAELVGSHSRLKMLYLLTIVDIRSVGPGIWNDWKAMLLRNLYQQTESYLDGHTDLEPAAKAKAVMGQLIERLPEKVGENILPLLKELPKPYWQNFDMLDLVRHARFYDKAMTAHANDAVHTRVDKTRDITELWVLTYDRPGLFADLCLAISSVDAQIVGARLNTAENGRVMNVFYLQNRQRLAFGRMSDDILTRLRELTQKTLSSGFETLPVPKDQVSKRAAAIPVTPNVKLLKTESAVAHIVEIEGRDRIGLLRDLAIGLRDCNLDVLSAHIEVMGQVAVDAFYVKTQNNQPLSAKDKKVIRRTLLDALEPERTRQTDAA